MDRTAIFAAGGPVHQKWMAMEQAFLKTIAGWLGAPAHKDT